MCDIKKVEERGQQLAVNTVLAFALDMLNRVSKEIEATKTELLSAYKAETGRDYKEIGKPPSDLTGPSGEVRGAGNSTPDI